MRIGIVAGESSGDLLAAGLMREITKIHPEATFEGVGGEAMLAAGLDQWSPLDPLAIMGLAEVLRHLPKLLKFRRRLAERWLANPPDVFIGVDAPEFNLGLEKRLHDGGIPTVHYVSPSVWAWRQRRVETVKKAVDHMLTLFPFEAGFYDSVGVPVTCVGHPAADRLPLEDRKPAAREALGLPRDGQVLAVLPGSRGSEVSRLGPVFAEAVARLAGAHPHMRFLTPLAAPRLEGVYREALRAAGVEDRVQCLAGQADTVMAAADVVLLASGTATLEATLLRRPMVVAYKVAPLTYFVLKHLGLVKIDRFALPNLLAKEDVVPEFIQHDATGEALANAVDAWFNDPAGMASVQARFEAIHQDLRRDADKQAARAVLSVIS